MIVLTVPEGRYAVVTTRTGQVGKVVSEAWRQIWALEDNSKLAHAYQKDFEVYDQRAGDPNHSQVDIYLGLK